MGEQLIMKVFFPKNIDGEHEKVNCFRLQLPGPQSCVHPRGSFVQHLKKNSRFWCNCTFWPSRREIGWHFGPAHRPIGAAEALQVVGILAEQN